MDFFYEKATKLQNHQPILKLLKILWKICSFRNETTIILIYTARHIQASLHVLCFIYYSVLCKSDQWLQILENRKGKSEYTQKPQMKSRKADSLLSSSQTGCLVLPEITWLFGATEMPWTEIYECNTVAEKICTNGYGY